VGALLAGVVNKGRVTRGLELLPLLVVKDHMSALGLVGGLHLSLLHT